jgi:outer membrane receptor protein involved in Fe transport
MHLRALLCLLVLPALAQAGPNGQDEDLGDFDDFDELYLGKLLDVVYTAARHEQEIGMSPSAVFVITREDIAASGATSITDMLRMVPGMEVVLSTPAFSAITTRNIWSDENNLFLVLIDGREANLEWFGTPLMEPQPILLEDVERIEVIRGPGSSLYGANAMAGVVYITTRPIPEKTAARIHLAGGEAGMLQLGGQGSIRVGDWGFSLGGGIDYFGTFVDPRVSGRQSWKLRSVVERRWSRERRLLLDAGISKGSGAVASAVGAVDSSVELRTLRLAYDSEDLKGHLYWIHGLTSFHLEAPLDFAGIRLARFKPIAPHGHVVDAEVQGTLPDPWESLLFIVGGGGRLTTWGADDALDAATFADITSSGYHQPGIDHWEARGNAFFHSELTPVEWVTVTGGLRCDYNTETGWFFSPRLAAVFNPAEGQFLRAGFSRGFRKPAPMETTFHMMVDFPPESPIQGAEQDHFLEFMTRVIGNSALGNEQLLSFDAGYVGQFIEGRLSLVVDLYLNLYTDRTSMDYNVIQDENGLPDLDNSSFMYINTDDDLSILGAELSVRYKPTNSIALLAWWAHREVFDREWETGDTNPTDLAALGGRWQTRQGLLGSLFLHYRGGFYDMGVLNPIGLFEPLLRQRMDPVFLVLAKLGWKWSPAEGVDLEAGLKLFLPVSPFSAPHFRFHEKGGGLTRTGTPYGGMELGRMMKGYLEGSF